MPWIETGLKDIAALVLTTPCKELGDALSQFLWDTIPEE
jgi:hypothetical protein